MSNPEESDRNPTSQPTQAWDPAEVPGLQENGDPAGAGATQRLPVQGGSGNPPSGAGATVAFTSEDIARLEEETAAVEQAAQEEDRLIGTLIRDKWKVMKRLGAGSFGTVYKVQDVKGGWTEALKILGVDRLSGSEAEEMRARFLREAQIMKRLGKESKHIVGLSTYEEDIEAGLIYFLMEFVEGRSLADTLAEEGPLPAERTVHLALQVCDALIVAHEGPEPVVHRDLKLENLMLTRDRAGEDIVKVLDFGIAKIVEREADSRLTTVGTLGTPGYAAPEQLRAEAVDGRTDLFAFGVILYALLTGRDPWLGHLAHEPTNQIYELMVATDRAQVRPMGEGGTKIPPSMEAIVLKLLSRNPDDRFQSARELQKALQAVASGSVPDVAPGGRSPTPTPASSENPEIPATRGRPTADSAPRPKTGPAKRRTGRAVILGLAVLAAGASVWARPWGRALDVAGLLAGAESGTITKAWVTEGGFEGGLRLLPIGPASGLLVPFVTPVPDGAVAETVERLRASGADVDASWEVWRLRGLAVEAQGRGRYYGADGSDVLSYARRLAALDPTNAEAASLLLKVGERMAWDAEAALADGTPGDAAPLVQQCLAIVPEHPRCLALSRSSP